MVESFHAFPEAISFQGMLSVEKSYKLWVLNPTRLTFPTPSTAVRISVKAESSPIRRTSYVYSDSCANEVLALKRYFLRSFNYFLQLALINFLIGIDHKHKQAFPPGDLTHAQQNCTNDQAAHRGNKIKTGAQW